jgi:hypothetical protein
MTSARRKRLGIIQQMAKNVGRSTERQRADDAEWFPWESDRQKIAFDDMDAALADKLFSQATGPASIWLDGEHAHLAASERKRQRP